MAVVGDVGISLVGKSPVKSKPASRVPRKTSASYLSGSGDDESSSKVVQELRKELESLRQEVTKLRKENVELLGLRKKVDGEIDELTAALFQEAYKMVNGAHEKRALVEKRLQESQGVVEGLEAESKALKVLLELGGSLPSSQLTKNSRKLSLPARTGRASTSGPSSPYTHTGVTGANGGGGGGVLQNRKEHPSSDCSTDGGLLNGSVPEEVDWQCGQVKPLEMELLRSWLPATTLSRGSPYIDFLFASDVQACLDFKNQDLSVQVLSAIEESTLYMERVPSQVVNTSFQCSLTHMPGKCDFRLKLTETGPWFYVGESPRDRIASVCDLYMYLRHIQQGLVKANEESVYWSIAKLRGKINISRLHLRQF